MSQRDQMKGVKVSRGARRGGISQKRANSSNRRKTVPLEVLNGQKPFQKLFS